MAGAMADHTTGGTASLLAIVAHLHLDTAHLCRRISRRPRHWSVAADGSTGGHLRRRLRCRHRPCRPRALCRRLLGNWLQKSLLLEMRGRWRHLQQTSRLWHAR